MGPNPSGLHGRETNQLLGMPRGHTGLLNEVRESRKNEGVVINEERTSSYSVAWEPKDELERTEVV